MTDKELRKLRRADLVEIIYRLQQEKEALQNEFEQTRQTLSEENARLMERLQNREVKIANAGSLAEVAASLTGLFEHAQETVELYLYNIKNMQKRENEKLEEIDRIYTETIESMATDEKETEMDSACIPEAVSAGD